MRRQLIGDRGEYNFYFLFQITRTNRHPAFGIRLDGGCGALYQVDYFGALAPLPRFHLANQSRDFCLIYVKGNIQILLVDFDAATHHESGEF